MHDARSFVTFHQLSDGYLSFVSYQLPYVVQYLCYVHRAKTTCYYLYQVAVYDDPQIIID